MKCHPLIARCHVGVNGRVGLLTPVLSTDSWLGCLGSTLEVEGGMLGLDLAKVVIP
jgi:hypothetical protein